MRISKNELKHLMERVDTLEKKLNAGGGNPYHDALGRFAESPAKAFGKYNAEPEKQDLLGYYDSYGVGSGGDKGSEILCRLDENDYKALAKTSAVLRKVSDSLDKDSLSDSAIGAVIDKFNQQIRDGGVYGSSLMKPLYDVSAEGMVKKYGEDTDPTTIAEMRKAEGRLANISRNIQKQAKKSLGKATGFKKVDATLAAINTYTYLIEKAMKSEQTCAFSRDSILGKKKNTLERLDTAIAKLEKKLNGGPGSGNFGHAGRPGKRGGSGKGQGSSLEKQIEDAEERLYAIQDELQAEYQWGGNAGTAVIAHLESREQEAQQELRDLLDKQSQQDYEESKDRQKDKAESLETKVDKALGKETIKQGETKAEDDANYKKFEKDIDKLYTILSKEKSRENFGQTEIRKLRDKWADYLSGNWDVVGRFQERLKAFEDWADNYQNW